jgi:hypothetical protein
MKSYKINLNNSTFTIDFPVLLLFLAVFLDTLSTLSFIGLNIGTEANPVLKNLISISIWFIPIYLFSTNAVFVPFLSKIPRKTLSYTFSLVSIVLSVNNFSLVLLKQAIVIDIIGFTNMVILFGLFGFLLFGYFLKTETDGKQKLSIWIELLGFLIFIGLIQFLFLIIGYLFPL